MHTATTEEIRIRRVEEWLQQLWRRLQNLQQKANKTAEDLSRNNPDSGQLGSGKFPKWAITTSTITARSGTTLGSGKVDLQIVSADPTTGVRTYSSMGVIETVYHGGTNTVVSGHLVQLKVIDGDYALDVDYC